MARDIYSPSSSHLVFPWVLGTLLVVMVYWATGSSTEPDFLTDAAVISLAGMSIQQRIDVVIASSDVGDVQTAVRNAARIELQHPKRIVEGSAGCDARRQSIVSEEHDCIFCGSRWATA